MPEVRHKRKKKADEKTVADHHKVVSAYSEEVQERNLVDNKRRKRLRLIFLIASIALLVGTILATFLILRYTAL